MGLIKKLFKAERNKSSRKKIKALESILKKFKKKRKEVSNDLESGDFKKKNEKRLKKELQLLTKEIKKGEKILLALQKEVEED